MELVIHVFKWHPMFRDQTCLGPAPSPPAHVLCDPQTITQTPAGWERMKGASCAGYVKTNISGWGPGLGFRGASPLPSKPRCPWPCRHSLKGQATGACAHGGAVGAGRGGAPRGSRLQATSPAEVLSAPWNVFPGESQVHPPEGQRWAWVGSEMGLPSPARSPSVSPLPCLYECLWLDVFSILSSFPLFGACFIWVLISFS